MPALPTNSILDSALLRTRPGRMTLPRRESTPRSGQQVVSRDLLRASFTELNRVAATLLSPHARRGIDPRTLVNEAARHSLGTSGLQELEDRGSYFAYLANALRRIATAMVLQAPRQQSARLSCPGLPDELTVDQMLNALDRLDSHSSRHSQIAVLRLFGGLSHVEIAEQLGISPLRAEVGWKRVCEWFAARQARN